MSKIKYTHEDKVLLKINLEFFAEGAGGERTEAPTPKRREKAREEGQVALSPEIATAFLYLIMFNVFKTFGPRVFNDFRRVFYISIEQMEHATDILDIRYATKFINYMFLQVVLASLPLLLIAMLIGLITNFLQAGWHPTLKPLTPKFSRLSPAQGFKKIFSLQAIMNFLKSIAKLFVIGYVIYSKLKDQINVIPNLFSLSFIDGALYFGNFVIDLGITVGAWFLIIAAIDYAYQRFKHEQELKMSKYELMQEYKESEGNPQVKSKIRQKMQESSMRRMMQAVPAADVIITNPTHYAIALKYDQNGDAAPIVLAKGVDYLAERIKKIGKENNIEIVENKELARTLYSTVDIGREIPPELYQAVAEILAYVFKLK